MEALDFAAAEHDRRRAVELLQAHGERDLLPTLWALLAATLLAQEKEDESERFLRMSESAGRHDWVTGMNAKEVRAELHARRGEFEQALRLARQALAHVEDTDDLDGRAHEQMHVAKMLFLAGRSGEAIPMLREARRLFDAKGQIVKGGLASAALRELEEPTGPRSEPTWLLLVLTKAGEPRGLLRRQLASKSDVVFIRKRVTEPTTTLPSGYAPRYRATATLGLDRPQSDPPARTRLPSACSVKP